MGGGRGGAAAGPGIGRDGPPLGGTACARVRRPGPWRGVPKEKRRLSLRTARGHRVGFEFRPGGPRKPPSASQILPPLGGHSPPAYWAAPEVCVCLPRAGGSWHRPDNCPLFSSHSSHRSSGPEVSPFRIDPESVTSHPLHTPCRCSSFLLGCFTTSSLGSLLLLLAPIAPFSTQLPEGPARM